ncbi:MAG: hypothetical protein AB8B64_10075 [Granulosicoccus sp.]
MIESNPSLDAKLFEASSINTSLVSALSLQALKPKPPNSLNMAIPHPLLSSVSREISRYRIVENGGLLLGL